MKVVQGISAIVTDIEGTTSSLSFVKDVLFPYARAHLPDYIRSNQEKLKPVIAEAGNTPGEAIETFLRWMDEDKKITPLKTLQGMIWQKGYDTGELQGHIYDDALRALKTWNAKGVRLYIYSSGSVPAQKLLFGHTPHGDLTPLFSGYFDTATGPKLVADSYTKIATAIQTSPKNILFLSDSSGEISAATQAGLQTILVNREIKTSNAIHTFDEITLQEKAA